MGNYYFEIQHMESRGFVPSYINVSTNYNSFGCKTSSFDNIEEYDTLKKYTDLSFLQNAFIKDNKNIIDVVITNKHSFNHNIETILIYFN